MADNQSPSATALSVFTFESLEIRTIIVDDQVEFVAADLAKALDYAEAKDMTRILDDDEKGRRIVPTPGGDQEMLTVNESGMYHAVIKSRKPVAKPFRKWVTSEVLPSIRKTGSYAMPSEPTISVAQQGEISTRIAERFSDGRKRPYAWSRFNNHFRLASYKSLPASKYDEALAYIAQLQDKDGSDPTGAIAAEKVVKSISMLLTVFGGQSSVQIVPSDAAVIPYSKLPELIRDEVPDEFIPGVIKAAAQRLKAA